MSDRTLELYHVGRRHLVHYSDQDHGRVMAYKWRITPCGRTYYVVRDCQREDGSWRSESMHRFLLGLTERTQFVDHINSDGLDNRRSNLRVVTPQQSACNRRKTAVNTTGYKGVTIVLGRYIRAQIKHRSVGYHLGHFETLEEAALAYDEAARRLHGEFARLNFPDRPDEAAPAVR